MTRLLDPRAFDVHICQLEDLPEEYRHPGMDERTWVMRVERNGDSPTRWVSDILLRRAYAGPRTIFEMSMDIAVAEYERLYYPRGVPA